MTRRIQDLRVEYPKWKVDIEESYLQAIDLSFRYLIEAIGDVPLDSMTREHAEQFMIWLMRRYPNRNTVKGYIKTIRPAFRWAMYARRWLREDVFAIPLPKVTQGRDRTYKPQEIERLLKATNPLGRLRILFAYRCGLRKGEMLNLRFSDIDLNSDKPLLHIQPRSETLDTWAWSPKSKCYRTLPLPDVLVEAVKQRRKELPLDIPYINLTPLRYYKLRYMLERKTLTSAQRKSPDQNFTPWWKRIFAKSGVKESGTYHDLRRTYGSEMAHEVPAPVLMYLMGHSDLQTTMKFYVRIDQSRAIEQARGISQIKQSGCGASLPGPLVPQTSTLTELSYTPTYNH